MARIDLVEPYAVRLARQSIRDSLMSHGEECILIHMWHVNEAKKYDKERCYICYDETYKGTDNFKCNRCFGTTYEGGVKDIYRAWGIFTDSDDAETVSRKGYWHPQASKIHTEHLPDLWQRDFVVRVKSWTPDHRVVDIDSIYVFKEVQNQSLRTGNRMGQTEFDNVSQIADLSHISEDMPIFEYGFVGKKFDRYDGNAR